MKLPQAFVRLPLRFDAERMAREVAALPDSAWQAHPTGYAGNSAVPLIAVDGGDNDAISGPMAETRHLQQSPYLRQVLAAFQVVLGRSRLMALAPGARVPRHCDMNYHWFTRVRIHIPVTTTPPVRFHCDDEVVHMAAGEAWIFDNWRLHQVENPTPRQRVHLVADTVGSAAFWRMVATAGDNPPPREQRFPFRPQHAPDLPTEQHNVPVVMHPAEMRLLGEDLLADLLAAPGASEPPARHFRQVLSDLMDDWQMLWLRYGGEAEHRHHFTARRDAALQALRPLTRPLPLASNARPAQSVVVARILIACVDQPLPGLKRL